MISDAVLGMPFWAEVLLNIAALAALALALVGRAWSDRTVSAVLGLLWACAAYSFRGSLPFALALALLFLAQALALANEGVRHHRLHFRFRARGQAALGILLTFSALAIYPNAVHLLGTHPGTSPSIAMPIPTAVFTLGLFLCAESVPGALWIAPALACAANFLAALRLGAAEELFLSSAGLMGALAGLVPGLWRRQPRPTPRASATRLM